MGLTLAAGGEAGIEQGGRPGGGRGEEADGVEVMCRASELPTLGGAQLQLALGGELGLVLTQGELFHIELAGGLAQPGSEFALAIA